MPPAVFAHVLVPESRLAYGRMWGTVTGADMLALVRAVHADVVWEPGFDAVWDCSAVVAHVVLPDDVEPIVAAVAGAGAGRDVLVESLAVGESALSPMLAAFCRRRGKDMTVHATLAGGLAALGHDAVPEAVAAALAPGRTAR